MHYTFLQEIFFETNCGLFFLWLTFWIWSFNWLFLMKIFHMEISFLCHHFLYNNFHHKWLNHSVWKIEKLLKFQNWSFHNCQYFKVNFSILFGLNHNSWQCVFVQFSQLYFQILVCHFSARFTLVYFSVSHLPTWIFNQIL